MAAERAGDRRLVGRADVVESLRERLAEVRAGSGAVTLLVGEKGVGKSTLVRDLVEEIRGHGVRALVGQAPALDDPPPFSLLSSAIEGARDDPRLRTDTDPLLGAERVVLGFAPGLGGTEFPTPVGIEARLLEVMGWTDVRGTTTRDEVLTGIAEHLLEYTRHGPTVLVLEDVDRADRSSLAAVEFFARELSERPLWILATARPADALSSTARARLETFERAVHAERRVLRPMTSAETAEYLRQRDAGRRLSAEEVARRHDESGGNPFLLEQLEHRAGKTSGEDERLDARRREVGADDRQILDLASVLGPEFPFQLLLGASEVKEEELAEEVDRLVGRGLLFERPGEVLEFPTDRLREEVYNFLSERRRRLLHRRAGTALEAMGRTGPSRIYALARHFYRGREPQKAVQYNRIAAEIAERSLAPEAAWEYYSHALESQREFHPGDLDGEAELVLGLARITEELGVLKEAEEILTDFFGRAGDDPHLSAGRRAALEVFLARILTDQGKMPPAAALAEKVLATPGLNDQPLVRLGAHHQLGMVRYYEGRYADALAHHTAEIALAQQLDNPLVVTRAQIWRIANLAMLGQTVQAIAEARAVTVDRDRLGSVRESGQAHLYLADILADARSPAADRNDALPELEVAIRYAQQAKDPRRVGWASYKSAELLREGGRLEEAADKARLAVEVLGVVGDQVGVAVATKVEGQIAVDRGEPDRADELLARAHRLLDGTGHHLEEADVVLRRGQLSLATHDPDGARQHLARLEALELPRIRPDLAHEFEAYRRAVAAAPPGPEGGDRART